MKNKISNYSKQYSIILLVIILLFFSISLNFVNATNSDNASIQSKPNITTTFSKSSRIKSFDDVYNDIVTNKELSASITNINGNQNNVIELPSNSKLIVLPDNNYVLEYTNNDTSILPKGSEISFENNLYVVQIPEKNTAFKVANYLELPIDEIISTATYSQSIKKLNKYDIKINLNEFKNSDLSENIEKYSINWGDGNTDEFDSNIVSTEHIYKNSGSYGITITVMDDFGFTHNLQMNFNVEYEGHLLHSYLWLDENKEPVTVSTSASVSLFALGLIAFTETGKYKLLALLPLLIPMYTRIQKEDVLDQFVRGQVYGFIKTNPGVHYNQIRREIGVKNGTLSYHLRVLEKTELIKSRREGMRYRAFYPTGMNFPKKERFRLTDLQIDIIDIIKKNPAITQKQIAKKLEKKPQTINYNIKVMEQADLIEVVKKGRKTKIFIKDLQDGPTVAE